jgi:hypothetical protein
VWTAWKGGGAGHGAMRVDSTACLVTIKFNALETFIPALTAWFAKSKINSQIGDKNTRVGSMYRRTFYYRSVHSLTESSA